MEKRHFVISHSYFILYSFGVRNIPLGYSQQSICKKKNESTRTIRVRLYSFSRILHLLPQHGTKNHLDVLDKGVMPIIVAVQTHLIRIYHVIVIPHSQLLLSYSLNTFGTILIQIFYNFEPREQ